MDTIGNRIEDIGKRKLGLTGKALATRLGVSYETLRKWKRNEGSPSAPRQKAIAKLLGEPIPVFMHGVNAEGGEPLLPDEARLLDAYRMVLKEDKAKFLKELEGRAREVDELTQKVRLEMTPPLSSGKRHATGG